MDEDNGSLDKIRKIIHKAAEKVILKKKGIISSRYINRRQDDHINDLRKKRQRS